MDLNNETSPSPHWIVCDKVYHSIAVDHSSFGNNYNPFKSYIDLGSGRLRVIGVGEVVLQTQCRPSADAQDPDGRSSIKIGRVLHVPDAPCNILGKTFLEKCLFEDCKVGDTKYSLVQKASQPGPSIACFEVTYWPQWNRRVPILKLADPVSDPELGLRNFKTALVCMAMAESKQLRQYEMNRMAKICSRYMPKDRILEAFFNHDEKMWLQQQYGDETRLLAKHDLDLFKPADRSKGRVLLRWEKYLAQKTEAIEKWAGGLEAEAKAAGAIGVMLPKAQAPEEMEVDSDSGCDAEEEENGRSPKRRKLHTCGFFRESDVDKEGHDTFACLCNSPDGGPAILDEDLDTYMGSSSTNGWRFKAAESLIPRIMFFCP